MRFLSNCIPVQAHTRMIQRRDRLPVPTSLLSHARHTRWWYYDARTNIAPLSRPKTFSVSMWLAE